MKIITWNINSIRLRKELVKKLVEIENPDVICFQEIKVTNELFPYSFMRGLGFNYIHVRGENSYNGVAILSKIPTINELHLNFVDKNDTRHIAVVLTNGIEVHNLYVPAGGDEPDTENNPKFYHKIRFLEELDTWFRSSRKPKEKIILLGDLNVAPLESDVWSHKQLLNVVSHTPIEINRLNRLKDSLDWHDAPRLFVKDDQKLYSWWSYRNKDWKKSNRGRRLDHIWVTSSLTFGIKNSYIISSVRDWPIPSDHVPVVAVLDNN